MKDLLLITDIPRLRKIFSRLADNSTRVRIASNLEKGGEELVAEKPTVVFVQTHLSGLSAEIILMHLKKQLGRKRTRFVLLATAEQVSREAIDAYQGYIDIAGSDEEVQFSTRELLSTLLAKPPKVAVPKRIEPEVEPEPGKEQEAEERPDDSFRDSESVDAVEKNALRDLFLPQAAPEQLPEPAPAAPVDQPNEPSPAEQGIAYPPPRSRISVTSEFNSSFDTVVETMEAPAKVTETLRRQERSWQDLDHDRVPPKKSNRKQSFFFWLVPVIIVVIIVTIVQQKNSKTEDTAVTPLVVQPEAPKTVTPAPVAAPVPPPAAVQAAAPAVPVAPVAAVKPAVTPPPAPAPVAPKAPAPVAAKAPAAVPAAAPPPAKATPAATSPRLKKLPDFVPRYGYDKNYGKENPGWERYKGQVTEFKILREGEGIKAIQVVDRGGRGVPESFMKGVLRQLAKSPSFEMSSTEKKEGYQIQRGRLSDTQDVVYYRDADGGRLRGFVVTWR